MLNLTNFTSIFNFVMQLFFPYWYIAVIVQVLNFNKARITPVFHKIN